MTDSEVRRRAECQCDGCSACAPHVCKPEWPLVIFCQYCYDRKVADAVAQELVQDRIDRAHAATADMEAYAAGQVAQALEEHNALHNGPDSLYVPRLSMDAKVAQAVKEREQQLNEAWATVKASRLERDQQADEIERLRRVLATRLEHLASCTYGASGPKGDYCSCGLRAAREALRREPASGGT